MSKRFKILRIVAGTILSGIGLFLTADNFLPVNKATYIKNESQLIALTGPLINDPYYHESSGGKGSASYFEIELNNYPDLTFKNESIFLKATDWQLIKSDVKKHDTVVIKVLKTDFEKYYLQKDSLNVVQQIAYYPLDKFSFYSFRFKNKEYVSNLFEAAEKHKRDNLFPQFLIGLAFIGMGIYSFMAKK
jgi:hypothetical protein